MNTPVLYVVATPIGNLEDMTLRALRILKEEVAAVFCEDTRQTRKLLTHYGIDHPSFPLHAHSHEGALDKAVSFLREGQSIAYVTDCGTPGVSDPGSRLVQAVRESGFAVSPLPGASALTALLSVSGFSGKNVIFGGFPSKKEGRRQKELARLASFPGIVVVYESPHRIKKTLASIETVFPGKKILVGREMTKMFEEFVPGTAASVSEKLKEKGEFAIAIDNTDPAEEEEADGRDFEE
jgi:16S rRNA (cytidine1402-2'-O)-methyltransferase